MQDQAVEQNALRGIAWMALATLANSASAGGIDGQAKTQEGCV